MTNKEAIEQLERISKHLGSIGEKFDYTDMAINALEEQDKQKEKMRKCIERINDRQKFLTTEFILEDVSLGVKEIVSARINELEGAIDIIKEEMGCGND